MQEEIGIRTAEAACFGQQIQLNGLHVRSCLVLGGGRGEDQSLCSS